MKHARLNDVPYCPKCGNKVDEDMAFCPKCGAALKVEKPRSLAEEGKEIGERMGKVGKEIGEKVAKRGKEIGERVAEKAEEIGERAEERARRAEKEEKQEKQEKGEHYEKGEAYEKREFSFIGPLIGGLIVIFLGVLLYLQVTGYFGIEMAGALFFVIIGVIVIAVGLYAASVARKRHPQT